MRDEYEKDYEKYPWLKIYDNPPRNDDIEAEIFREELRPDLVKPKEPHPPGSLARRLEDLLPKPGEFRPLADPVLIFAKELEVLVHDDEVGASRQA